MAKKKTVAELQTELRLLRRTNISSTIAGVINNFFKWAGISCVSYCMFLSINALAGQQTAASILVNVLGDIKISQALAYLMGAGGVVYGINERRLRQKTVKHIQTRNIALEKRIDPKRSSSTLTEIGETNPVDEE